MKEYIGIITAMDEELNAIKNIVENKIEKTIYNVTFIEGTINKQDCVLLKCGVGKVNSARATQILIDNFCLKYVINLGSAGAINDNLNYGDVVIGEKLVQHDFDITAFGHKKGYITDTGSVFESEKNLIEKSKNIFSEFLNSGYKIIVGTIASGDIFCTDIKMKEKINKKFDADCVEMEGAAIAQVCYLCNIPFIVIRSISDIPNGNNNIDFNEYLNLACERCVNFISKFI